MHKHSPAKACQLAVASMLLRDACCAEQWAATSIVGHAHRRMHPDIDQDNNLALDSRFLRRLKAHEHGLHNCVCSIVADQDFIRDICGLYPYPAFANLRCGLWYLRQAQQTCYYKSTDGHFGNWGFSSTRLNLHVAFEAARHGGCVLVDATKKGKVFPDAFSKTVPIWAAVVNRAVMQLSRRLPSPAHLSHTRDWDDGIHLPPWVADSEKQQIAERVDAWVVQLLQSGAQLEGLAATLAKPLRCLWVSQQSRIWLNQVADLRDLPFTPLVLVSASDPAASHAHHTLGMSQSSARVPVSYQYVPGAGDDEETWGCGLTADMLHAHQQELLEAGPDGIHACVKQLLESQPAALPHSSRQGSISWIHDSGLGVADVAAVLRQVSSELEAGDCIIDCSHPPLPQQAMDGCLSTAPGAEARIQHTQVPVPASKPFKQGLVKQLPTIISVACAALQRGGRVVLCDRTGEDACVCACIALLHVLGRVPSSTGAASQGLHWADQVDPVIKVADASSSVPADAHDGHGARLPADLAHSGTCSGGHDQSPGPSDALPSSAVAAGELIQKSGPCDRLHARQLLALVSMYHPQAARVSRKMVKQVSDFVSASLEHRA